MTQLSENKMKSLYRGFLDSEIQRPEAAHAKKDFICSYFYGGSFLVLGAAWLVVSALTVGMFLFFIFYPVPVFVHEEPESTYEKTMQFNTIADVAAVKPAVIVKRVTSRMGSVMVYQNGYPDKPVTVVWVFAGGKAI